MINKFHKILANYTPDQLQKTFLHSRAVWEAVSKTPCCFTPKPLAINLELRSIDYEFVELPQQSISTLVQKQTYIKDILLQVGGVLASLHKFNNDKKLMHGDFVLHNIFFEDDRLFVIDAHPPEKLEFREDILYGEGVRDVLFFIISIPICIGFRKSIRCEKYIGDCCRAFIQGYFPQRSEIYLGCFNDYYLLIKDLFIIKCRSMGIKKAVLHVIGCVYWLWKCRSLVYEG